MDELTQEDFGVMLKSGIVARIAELILEREIEKKTSAKVSIDISEFRVVSTDTHYFIHADISGKIKKNDAWNAFIFKGGKK